MVYRGKPSAGCENCRKAKKRCTLELPACARCVKLKKDCVGYRDTSQLQIQDETQAVLQKAEKKKGGLATSPSPTGSTPTLQFSDSKAWNTWQIEDFNSVPVSRPLPKVPQLQTLPVPTRAKSNREETSQSFVNAPTAITPISSSSALSHANFDNQGNHLVPQSATSEVSPKDVNHHQVHAASVAQWAFGFPKSVQTSPDEVAVNYFFKSCVADGSWAYFPHNAYFENRDKCLDLAVKACGMAALDNVRHIPEGRQWSRRMYTRALGLLNNSLQDSKRSRMDSSLIAVTMLSFYENLVCDSMQSIQSWKAHIHGATQLLKVRGKAQFQTEVGRRLFREIRAQIMIACVWDDRTPPDFLMAWQDELISQSGGLEWLAATDKLGDLCFQFADLRSKLKFNSIDEGEALQRANDLDAAMLQWALETYDADERWRYDKLRVARSPHVWNCMLHAYSGLPVPEIWNMYRSIRILVSRIQEQLSRRFHLPPEERKAQNSYLLSVRRELADDICGSVPCLLGQATPAFSSPCVLVTAYNSVWPMFLAATCAFEFIGLTMWDHGSMRGDLSSLSGANLTAISAAAEQAHWLLARLDYISDEIGLHWANGIANSLREAVRIHQTLRQKSDPSVPEPKPQVEYMPMVQEILQRIIEFRKQLEDGA